jgi:long-chain acyl-CoA synthetase
VAELIQDSEGFLNAARCGLAIAWWAKHDPQRPAVIAPTGERSFAELNERANRLGAVLRRHGLAAGDAIALICSNRPEFAEVWAACQRTGLRLTPINWHLTAAEAAYIADDCEAKALIVDHALGAIAGDVAAATPRATLRLGIGDRLAGFDSYEDALASAPGLAINDSVLGTIMLYTSGTTGRPKGVQRVAQNEIVAGLHKAYGYRHGDVHLCTGPLYHAAPLNISFAIPVSTGVTVVMMERWNAEECLRLIERHKVTHTHMVPTMFHRLLALEEPVRRRHELSSLRAVVHGAAPCPVHVKHAMIDWLGPIVYEYYAATEGAGTVVDSRTWLKKPGTVGKPNPVEQIIVADEQCQPLPAGTAGLVWLRSPADNRFAYFKDAEKTSRTYHGDYFTLGDVGYLDADGYLFLTDRSSNLIISGGVNIYPAEVDAALLDHPAVGDAATIGVPNVEWGEEVKAVVELQPGIAPTPALADELIAFCRARLAHFKCPRSVDFIDRLPRQDNGKIYKRLLRERYR